jgi:hypothetical protein
MTAAIYLIRISWLQQSWYGTETSQYLPLAQSHASSLTRAPLMVVSTQMQHTMNEQPN